MRTTAISNKGLLSRFLSFLWRVFCSPFREVGTLRPSTFKNSIFSEGWYLLDWPVALIMLADLAGFLAGGAITLFNLLNLPPAIFFGVAVFAFPLNWLLWKSDLDAGSLPGILVNIIAKASAGCAIGALLFIPKILLGL